MKRNLLLALFVPLWATGLLAQDLFRGPYQQALTQSSVKMMWSTSTPSTAWVKIGTNPNALETVFSSSAIGTDHIVDVTGLNPKSIYYYAIGYDEVTLAGGDAGHFIKTAQLAGDTSSFSFWAIGDFGKANTEQRATRISFENYNKSQARPVDFGIMLGDNAYNDGTQSEYQAKVFDRNFGYDSLFRFLHFYSTPGNHDYNSINRFEDPSRHVGPYFDVFKSLENGEAGGVPSNSKLYYSHDYGNVHFVNINSELFQWTGIKNSPMERWLIEDLKANTLPWVIVYFHQPPYSSGSHISDDFWEIFMKNIRVNFVPIFDEYGVDLVLSGHSHVYERSMLINGLYTNSGLFDASKHVVQGGSGNPDEGQTYVKQLGGKGTIYNVVGNSGSSTSEDKLPSRIHPIFVIQDAGRSICGSLVVDVSGSTLTGTYVSSTGEILDRYQIFKQLPTSTTIKENFASKIGLKAYPNPSRDFLSLSFQGGQNTRGSITVSDISGRKMIAQTVQVQEGTMVLPIHGWAKLAAGTYVVTLEFSKQPASITVIKGQ
jgi:acid phosphatase type 7